MRPKVSAFIATSTDGFIARSDDGLDWLDKANLHVPKGENCGYTDFFVSVDALVMGRATFEKVLKLGDWPYKTKPVIVLGRDAFAVPEYLPVSVSSSAETPRQLIDRLASEGVGHIYVDGGVTIQRFLAEGLLNEITVTIVPILIGSGKRLFGELGKDVGLKLLSAKAYDFGFVQMKYAVNP